MATDPPLPPNLGRYRAIRRLGTGGMAEVFLARSTGAEGIEKTLVVKRILPTFARNVKFISMFVDEAKVAMRLNHTNIVQVYAFERVKEHFLLAMEFVDGVDLGRLVAAADDAGVRVPFELAAYVVMEVAKGLEYAHHRRDEQGEPMEIVHRDVSPQNVLLSYEGAVKLADFGIARARLVTEDTGVIKGKFTYMSPEQARGERVDCRSDVYALGVLLGELLMQRPMYPGKHGLDALEEVRQGNVTLPQTVDPSVPDALDEIVRRATAFDRGDRFQTARALAGALGQWLHRRPEVVDAIALEGLLRQLFPRQAPGSAAPDGADEAAVTIASKTEHGGPETRDRRHIVCVSGVLRFPPPAAPTGADLALEAEYHRILEALAYKYDAVLRWPDLPARGRFRLVLGVAHPRADNALRAMGLALDVLEATHALSEDHNRPIAASLGISRGEASVVREVSGLVRDLEGVDAVFEVGDGLASAAVGGVALAAGEVYRLVRRDFLFEDLHAVRLPGLGTEPSDARSIRAYRLSRARSSLELAREGGATANGRTGLVGRANELRFLQEVYRDVCERRRSEFLKLTGEIGVGKTALVAAALESLAPQPRVLRTECAFGTADRPFEVLADIVRSACGVDPAALPDEARGRIGETLAGLELGPEARDGMREVLELLVGPATAPPAGDAPDDDRFRTIVAAARQFIGALAARDPLVLWIDGLQWADTPSVELLGRLLRSAYPVPLLVVLSLRPDPRVEAAIANVPGMEVGELDGEERRHLLRARFQGADIPDDVEEAIVSRAGGNPFFLSELVEALVERGVVSVEQTPRGRRVARNPGMAIVLPTTLEDAIGARLAELGEPERRMVEWLAVVGSGASAERIGELARTDPGPALRVLVARKLVEELPDGTYDFPSAVIGHVAYRLTEEGERRRMHRRLGALLAVLPGEPPARVARHLELAGDAAGAADAYLRAAGAARELYSNHDALRHYASALRLLPPSSTRRIRVHEARAQILRGMGRRAEELRDLEAMRGLAEGHGDPAALALVYNRLARHRLDSAHAVGVEPLVRRALEAAREAREVGAEVEALRLEALLAREQGNIDAALTAVDRALARVAGDPELLVARGSVLAQQAAALLVLGRHDAALAAGAEALAIFRRRGIKRNESYVLNVLGEILGARGAYEDAILAFRASLALDREIGDRYHLGWKLSNTGQLYGLLGDYDRAWEFLERALAVFERADDPAAHADALCCLAEIEAEARGELGSAGQYLDMARQFAAATGRPYDQVRERLVRAGLELRRGQLEAAEEAARAAVGLAEQIGIVGQERLGRARLAEILAARGERAAAMAEAEYVRSRMFGGERVERAERIYLSLARALHTLGESRLTREAYEAADRQVTICLDAIRTPALRDRYLAKPSVRDIRAHAG